MFPTQHTIYTLLCQLSIVCMWMQAGQPVHSRKAAAGGRTPDQDKADATAFVKVWQPLHLPEGFYQHHTAVMWPLNHLISCCPCIVGSPVATSERM